MKTATKKIIKKLLMILIAIAIIVTGVFAIVDMWKFDNKHSASNGNTTLTPNTPDNPINPDEPYQPKTEPIYTLISDSMKLECYVDDTDCFFSKITLVKKPTESAFNVNYFSNKFTLKDAEKYVVSYSVNGLETKNLILDVAHFTNGDLLSAQNLSFEFFIGSGIDYENESKEGYYLCFNGNESDVIKFMCVPLGYAGNVTFDSYNFN